MGIKNLNAVLKKNHSFPKKNIKDIKHSIVAVDFSLFLYRFLYNQNNPVECFLRQLTVFFKNNILPVYVLDGSAPVEKNEIINKRANKRIKISEELKKLLDLKEKLINDCASPRKLSLLEDEILRLEKKCVQFSKENTQTLINFFEMCGVPVIKENYESDWILAQLSKNNLVDYILSEDSDILVYGAKKIMKNFCIQEESFYLYERDKILDSIGFNNDEFIDMCILSGCDYAPKIKFVNSLKSFEMINSFRSIENIRDLPINIDSVNLARNIFKKEADNDMMIKIKDKIIKKEFSYDRMDFLPLLPLYPAVLCVLLDK